VECFDDIINNNPIEAFNGQFKAWYKPKRGFKSFDSANLLISLFVFFYNFVRPHSSLNNLAPAQVAGAMYSDKETKVSFDYLRLIQISSFNFLLMISLRSTRV